MVPDKIVNINNTNNNSCHSISPKLNDTHVTEFLKIISRELTY